MYIYGCKGHYLNSRKLKTECEADNSVGSVLNFLILITTLRGGRWTGRSGREVVGLALEVNGQRGGAEGAAYDKMS